MQRLATQGLSLDFDPECGIIDNVAIEADGKTLRPLHRAPWVVGGETLGDEVAPVERKLAGDFFCAPFARAEGDAPIHGWSANGSWEPAGSEAAGDGAVTTRYRLRQSIQGAALEKRITLVPGHPVIYQSHVFEGGTGRLPVAHHAMVHVPGGARLSFSSKELGRTTLQPLETDPARGRSILAYPQEFASLAKVQRADGGNVDARNYPFDRGHEDLIVLSEQPGNRLGWSAALAARDGFLFFAVKDAVLLPQTVLWMSNGGRSYAPWNGRHTAVLGLEEGAVGIHLKDGEKPGTPVDLELGARTEIRSAFGAIPVPAGWTEVADIRVADHALTLMDAAGGEREVAFRGAHFG
ncbi:MAG: hypothetical protein AB7S80_19495 [Rhizobiaceae bacterium]